MKLLVRFLLIAVVVSAIGGGLYFLQQKKSAELAAISSQQPPPAAVATATVRRETWPEFLFAVGSISPVQGVNLTTEVAGQITEFRFDSGAHAARGDVLVRLDTSVDQAQLNGLEAELRLQQISYDRAARLVKQRTISASDFDAAEARRDEAAAAVAAKRAMISKKTIVAPFSGRLGIRQVGLGAYLEPGDTIVALLMVDPVAADFTVPERYLSQLELGQTIDLSLEAFPDEVFVGVVRATEAAVDQGTRNIRVRARVDNPDERLRIGMFTRVRVDLGAARGVLTVPETAISFRPYGNSVFKLVDNQGQLAVEIAQVKTGESREGQVEVLEGLAAGDRIVAIGHNKLRSGMPVQVVGSGDASLTQARTEP